MQDLLPQRVLQKKSGVTSKSRFTEKDSIQSSFDELRQKLKLKSERENTRKTGISSDLLFFKSHDQEEAKSLLSTMQVEEILKSDLRNKSTKHKTEKGIFSQDSKPFAFGDLSMEERINNSIAAGKTLMELTFTLENGKLIYFPSISENYSQYKKKEKDCLYPALVKRLQTKMKDFSVDANFAIAAEIIDVLTSKTDEHWIAVYLLENFTLVMSQLQQSEKLEQYSRVLEEKDFISFKYHLKKNGGDLEEMNHEWISQRCPFMEFANDSDIAQMLICLRQLTYSWPEFCHVISKLTSVNEVFFWYDMLRYTQCQCLLEKILNGSVNLDQLEDFYATISMPVPEKIRQTLGVLFDSLQRAWLLYMRTFHQKVIEQERDRELTSAKSTTKKKSQKSRKREKNIIDAFKKLSVEDSD